MLDIIEVLETLQSAGLIKLSRVIGQYYQIYCPFHNNGQERKPSCGVLLEDQYKNGQLYPKGLTHCFTCGYAKTLPEMITDLLNMFDIDQTGEDWLISHFPEYKKAEAQESLLPKDTVDMLNNQYMIQQLRNMSNTAPISFVTEEELAKYRYTVPYMYNRKLTDEVIERYDVGVDMNWIPPGRKNVLPCITFPVRDKDGNTLFLCRRAIDQKFFHYPSDVTKPVYGIYELPANCKSVIVCESCFNALTCAVYGKPAVALLGTGNSYQIDQLRSLGVNEFILALDPDEAGQRGTRKLKKALKDVAIVWSYVGIPEGKDLNDLTKEEFDALQME